MMWAVMVDLDCFPDLKSRVFPNEEEALTWAVKLIREHYPECGLDDHDDNSFLDRRDELIDSFNDTLDTFEYLKVEEVDADQSMYESGLLEASVQ